MERDGVIRAMERLAGLSITESVVREIHACIARNIRPARVQQPLLVPARPIDRFRFDALKMSRRRR